MATMNESYTGNMTAEPLRAFVLDFVAQLPDPLAAHSLLTVYDVLQGLGFRREQIEAELGEPVATCMRLLAGDEERVPARKDGPYVV